MEFFEDSRRRAVESEKSAVHECSFADCGWHYSGKESGSVALSEYRRDGICSVPGAQRWDELEANRHWRECDMNGLYPIIRRARRPLIIQDDDSGPAPPPPPLPLMGEAGTVSYKRP